MLLAGTQQPLTGRGVSRLVRRGSQAGVNRALLRLSGQGLVTAQRAGNAVLYSLNRQHLAADAVLSLAGIRSRLIEQLKTELKRWAVKPIQAAMFGSAARGDGDEASDIDLFVVRPGRLDAEDNRWRQQLSRLAELVFMWTGNHLGIAEVGLSELASLRRRRPEVVQSLERDAVTLLGSSTGELLKVRPRRGR